MNPIDGCLANGWPRHMFQNLPGITFSSGKRKQNVPEISRNSPFEKKRKYVFTN